MATKTKKTAAVIGLLVSTKRDDNYFTMSAHPVFVGPAPDDLAAIDRGDTGRAHVPTDRVRNVGYDKLVNGLWLDNLRVTCQGNSDDERRHVYDFRAGYFDLYSVDSPRDLMAMAKTLQAIDTRLDKMTDEYGSIRQGQFGQYLLRVCKAIGATRIVTDVNGRRRGWSHDDQPYRISEVRYGADTVDRIIDEWVREKEIAAEKRAEEVRQREYEASVADVAPAE